MNSTERTKIISNKIGNRKLRFKFPELGYTGKISIKLMYPNDIDYKLDKKSLEKEVLLHIEEIRIDIQKDINSILESRMNSIELEYNLPEYISIRNQKIWEFKLNVFQNEFDSINYKSQLNEKFTKLKKDINFEIKKIKGKKFIMDWINNNPYLETFPMARNMEREFIFHMGPTNSGKTYTAIQDLKKSKSGCYLAPLRLLAHEVYDELNKDGVYCSLITGEERIEVPSATVISSTIEMANCNKTYDVAIVDEIQMIHDENRGWAWVQSVCGLPAKKIYLAGSEEALPFVKKLVEEILKEKLTVVEFKRKNDLVVENEVFDISNDIPKDGDAFIVFSRKNVFELKERLGVSSSIIYGSLSPEVRKSEARKFRDRETKVVISTDAIGMGLNLPISRIIFVDDKKYNGIETVRPDSQLVKQISGRAGRYGFHENGYVTSIDKDMLRYISSSISKNKTYETHNYKFQISPNINLIKEVSDTIGTTNLSTVLEEIEDIFLLDPEFELMDIQQMILVSGLINTSLSLDIKYVYSCSPINTKMDRDKDTFRKWSNIHKNNNQVKFSDIPKLFIRHDKNTQETLWYLENHIKLLSCYLWMNGRFPEIYTEIDKVNKEIESLNEKIITMLDKSK